MDELGIEGDKKLLKALKKDIKAWEHDFFEQNQRKPTKAEIAELPEIGMFIHFHISKQCFYSTI